MKEYCNDCPLAFIAPDGTAAACKVAFVPNDCDVFKRQTQFFSAAETGKANHPAHYNTGIVECIDAIESALTPEEFEGFCKGNIIKYVWRENHKGGREDLEKAVWYLKRLIEKGRDDNG